MYCGCGCGNPAPVATRTLTRDGAIKGQPKRFIHGHNSYGEGPLWIEEDRGYDTPCYIWQRAFNTQGHAQVTVGRKCYLAHRYYYQQKYGLVSSRLHIHHRCEQYDCVNLEHLEVLTPAQHARLRKNAKLNWQIVDEMRALYKEGGYSYRTLSIKYGVAPSTVADVINRRRWRPSP